MHVKGQHYLEEHHVIANVSTLLHKLFQLWVLFLKICNIFKHFAQINIDKQTPYSPPKKNKNKNNKNKHMNYEKKENNKNEKG